MTDLLAIGGYSDAITGRIDRYDPAADRWTCVGYLGRRRDLVAAAILDGRIYVCGGRNAEIEDDNAVEHSDLTARSWVDDAWLKDPRRHHAAVGLGGKLYVFGGFWGNDRQSSIHVFDPGDGRWSRCGELPVPMGPAIASVTDGRLWVAGEVQSFQWELWSGDLPAGRWTREAALSLDRRWPAVCALDRSFYFCGGTTEQGLSGRVDRFDLGARSLQTLPDLLTARGGASAVGADGRVYVLAGDDGISAHGSSTLETFELADQTWRSLAPLQIGRTGVCALAIE